MKTKTHEEKECDRMMVDLESIDHAFERSIATANLLSIAHGHQGQELDDKAIPNAAFHLYRDLKRLEKLVHDVIDRAAKSGFRDGQEKELITARLGDHHG